MLAFLLILTCCCTPDLASQRLSEEYGHWRPSSVTPVYSITIYFPCWLSPEDRPGVLAVVDDYASAICTWYPEAVDLEWNTLEVMIHDSPEICVSAPPSSWVGGWIRGNYIVVCWALQRVNDIPVALAEKNCLPSLPHEFMHAVIRMQYRERGHSRFIGDVARAINEARARSLRIRLKPETHEKALAFRYDPYTIPGFREN